MIKILINKANLSKIEKILNDVQKRQQSRLLNLSDIINFKNKLQKAKKSMLTYVEHVNCNSYSKITYYANSTQVTIQKINNRYYITELNRVSLSTKKGYYDLKIA